MNPYIPQPNAFERRGLAERERADKLLAAACNGPPIEPTACHTTDEIRLSDLQAPYTLERRNDPSAGILWVAEKIGPTILTAILPDTRLVEAHWFNGQDVPKAAAWVAQVNAAGFNTYFSLQIIRAGLEKKKKAAKVDIETLRIWAWLDLDMDGERDLPALLNAIQALPPPSDIIMSGGGIQPIWKLKEPLPASSENIARCESVNKYLAGAFGGDDVQDVSRILRLPFTINYPNEKKKRAGRVESLSGLLREGGGT